MKLENKTAIVTGASGGLGRACSVALAKRGVTVYGLARRGDKLDELHTELGERFVPVRLDVTDADGLSSWVDQTFTAGEGSTPDILINNAGMANFGAVDELSLGEWQEMIDTNLNGIFYLTRLVVPLMKANPEVCHIINIASIAGLLGNPRMSGYNASKFAVRGFSEALFKELRQDGIKVSALFPGSIATDFFKRSQGAENHPYMMMPDDVAATILHLLETPDEFLINEITLRPLKPRPS